MATNTEGFQSNFEWVDKRTLYRDSPYVANALDRRERSAEAAGHDDRPDLPAGREDRCQSCESPVTQRYRRVAGDRHDIAWACPACATYMQRFDGAAADPDYPLDDIRAGGDRHD